MTERPSSSFGPIFDRAIRNRLRREISSYSTESLMDLRRRLGRDLLSTVVAPAIFDQIMAMVGDGSVKIVESKSGAYLSPVAFEPPK